MYHDMFSQNDHFLSPPLKGEELIKAIEHLYNSLEIVDGIVEKITEGIFDGVFASSDLAKGWFEINCCRIYTEDSVWIEEYLQPAMGSINDAKCMIDSLVASGYGLTRNSRLFILASLQEAMVYVRTVLEELESWISVDSEGSSTEDAA